MCEINSCADFETWINEALDARKDPRFDQRIARHSRECPDCEAILSAYVKVENLVAAAFSNPAAVAERERIECRRRSTSKVQMAIGALAASILVLIVVERGSYTVTDDVPSADAMVRSEPMPLNQFPGRQTTSVSLTTCYELTSELPGIRPIRSSVNATLNLIQQLVPTSNNRSEPAKLPGLGDFKDGRWALAVV